MSKNSKGGFAARKPGFPPSSSKANPLQREYDQAPRSAKHKGKDKPKVTDLAFGDRSKAKMPPGMVSDTDYDGE